MGRFGLEFSDKNNNAFASRNKPYYGSVSHQRRQWFESDVEGGRFQRALAWISYFVLVLTSIAVFTTPASAFEFASPQKMEIRSTISHSLDHAIGQWDFKISQ